MSQYCVPKGTTHLMMWFGSSLPEKRAVAFNPEVKYTYELGEGEDGYLYVNYVKTLQEECKKMEGKGEACIFVYDSRFLSLHDKQQLQDVVSSIPNCYFVDYKEFVKKVKKEPDIEYNKQPISRTSDDGTTFERTFKKNKQSDFIDDIENLIKSNVKKQNFGSLKKNSMGNLVDCARMLLLHHPRKLKELAIENAIKNNSNKSIKLEPKDCSLLYHDFDLIQKTQPDIQHTQNKQNDNMKFEKDKPYLIFQKNMHGSTACGVENSLIFAISPNDKNERIDNIWCWYMNPIYVDGPPLFNVLGNDKEIELMGMDVSGHWKDENHCSWKIEPGNPKHIVNRDIQNTENKQDINKNKENNEENGKNQNELNQEYINENIKIDENIIDENKEIENNNSKLNREKEDKISKKEKEEEKENESIENNTNKETKNELNQEYINEDIKIDENINNEEEKENEEIIKEAYIQSNRYEDNEEDKKEEITNQPRRTIKHQQKLTNNKDCKKPLTFKQWLSRKSKQKKEEQKKTKKLCKEMIKYQYNLYYTVDSKRYMEVPNPYTGYKPVYADIPNRTSSHNTHSYKGGKKMVH